MRKKICIVCKKPLPTEPLIRLDQMPSSAQDIPSKEELSEDEGISLDLFKCSHCGLVQFACQPVSYYKDVIRSGGYSTTMVDLRTRQFRHLIDTYHLEGKKLIEAGCGQGEFLSVLSRFPVEAYGIEHRDSLVSMAQEKGLKVWKQFAGEGELLSPEDGSVSGPYDGFLSFNFLEHQTDPVAMLRCLANNLVEEGIGLITVPSLEYIIQYDGYYELIRDHLAYYTFQTLQYTVEAAGFEVLEKELINRDTLSVIVRKRKQPLEQEPSTIIEEIDGKSLLESRESIASEIKHLIDDCKSSGKRLALWGASHQGFTLASTTAIGEFASYMIDSAPFKQGKYAPASHLPIVGPEHFMEDPVDKILIVAPGYTEEIAGIIREKLSQDIEILALKSNHLERI